VELLLLGALTIILAYASLSAFDTSLPVLDLFGIGRPPLGLGILFVVVAAFSLAATMWQVRRRLNPNVDVVADTEGIASQQTFWGRGRLAWSEITRLESKYQGLLYIYGITSGGDVKRLAIDTRQIDVPAADLYAAIARHRPDLIKMPRN